jgi:1-acyl-sn-glycerol-3-phosphate acyltransferase
MTALRTLLRWVVLRPVSRWFLRIHISGLSNCAGLEQPILVVANHNSHWDSVLVHGYLPIAITRHLATAAAADHFFTRTRRPLAPRLLFNAFPVERRGKGGRAPRGLTGDLLDHGTSVLIFPEGTRSKDGTVAAFTPGAAGLAVRRGLTCLPIQITGTWQAWPSRQSRPRRPRRDVAMVIGEPVTPRDGESIAAFNQRLQQSVNGTAAAA